MFYINMKRKIVLVLKNSLNIVLKGDKIASGTRDVKGFWMKLIQILDFVNSAKEHDYLDY